MIVSGGHILAIDRVDHDFTLSGDGVKTPIGIAEELLEKIRDVSEKLDTSAFESWSAKTEHWDVQEYSGGDGIKVENHLISVSAKYLTSGDLEPYATKKWVQDQEFLTSVDLEHYAQTEWVQEELEKKQDASEMSAYAQSAWVDENFQPKGDYITPEDLKPYATSAWVNVELGKKVDVSAMSAYATSSWVDQNFLKQADYHEYSAGNDYIRIDEYKVYGYDWTSAVSALPFKLDTSSFNDYSAWSDDTYLKQKDLDGYATSAGLVKDHQYAMTSNGWAPVDITDKTVVSGTSGISAQKIGDTWIVGTSAKFATSGDIDEDKQYALTTSGWTEVQTSLEIANSAIQGVKLHGAKTRITPDASNIVTIPIFSTDFPGLVPSATFDDADKVLKGDGTWGEAGSSVRVIYDAQSEELHLDFRPTIQNVVNIGGRDYKFVQIGNQLWLAENLDYKFAYNGSTLPIGVSGSPSTPSAWYYDNDESTYGVNGNKYGLLYNWYAAKYLDDNKSTLLPEGWHVPTTTDWDTLAVTCGGAGSCGTKLKSTTGWNSGNGDDSYGFSAFPSGHYSGSFYYLGSYAYFWSSIERNSNSAYYRRLDTGTSLNSNDNNKTYGYSIRLVKNLT